MTHPSHRSPVAEEIRVSGLVQGVGFRPFVWRLAHRLGLCGSVRNDGDAVVILAQGVPAALDALEAALRLDAPAAARVAAVRRAPVPPLAVADFTIAASGAGEVVAGVVADLATCPECLAEMDDPTGRRYGYPFTNCTACGPRFSIVEGLPYDRARTTMRGFSLCPACQAEYADPTDRRFHAQPIACPACGPRLLLEGENAGEEGGDDPLVRAVARVRAGGIIAVKGIGGYHFVCDATSEAAVATLRARKNRPAKPLAVLLPDLAAVTRHCRVTAAEARALTSAAAPIVLLPRRDDSPLAAGIAPGLARVGVLLPYSPLHHLLIRAAGCPLVLTSANRAGQPQLFRDDRAGLDGLTGLADLILRHDRPIARRLDDSVMMLADDELRVLRRARGLAPQPVPLPPGFADCPPVLALGGDMKGAVCLTQGGLALLSHHLGDLHGLDAQDAMDEAIADYTALFTHQAALVAVDRHPAYHTGRRGADLARARGLPLEKVQHHHAHVAAVLAERGWPREGGPVIGIALDGLGWGDDDTAWGAEVLCCDYTVSRRVARLRPVPLPGGDQASREPWRMLLSHLDSALGADAADAGLAATGLGDLFAGKPVATLRAMMTTGVNAPPASSAGRLFDAVAALLRLAPDRLSHEGEAAMALEALAGARGDGDGGGGRASPLPFATRAVAGLEEIDPAPMWLSLLHQRAAGVDGVMLAAAFHDGLAAAFADAAIAAARREECGHVVLAGGVMQNARLLAALRRLLTAAGLEVWSAGTIPTGDGGLALGQAVVAAARRRTPSADRR